MFSWLLIAALPMLAADAPATKAAKGIDFERARKHWSFRPLRTVPTGATVDGLMKPGGAIQVNARILARRAYLDAIGLPPTIEEAAATAQRPWAETVDALLASPHFGERWGRHWLDCVRFAETDGHEFDVDKPNAFRYRDYVIRALNDDVPYNRFVLEHLAGDLLQDKRIVDGLDQSTIATGFYWLGEVINTPVDSVQSMADRVDNQIDVLGKAFLGLTTACARCHDHKFDPIPTADYYALAGIMHSSRPHQAAVAGPSRAAPERAQCAGYSWQFSGAGFECVEGRVTSGKATFAATGSAISNTFTIPKRYLHVRLSGASEMRLVVDEYRFPPGRQRGQPSEMKWATIDLKMVEKRTAYFELADLEADAYLELEQVVFSDQKEPPASLSLARVPGERGDTPAAAFALATTEGEPLDVGIYLRGDHKSRGAIQPRRFLTLFSGAAQLPIHDGSGRRELAERLLKDAEPLLARVAVNRIWHHYFGQGIVATPDNFGLTGQPPTNPELLDWLASELIRNGWRQKPIHRLILNSHAYQTRVSPRRLDAETVRDAMLAVAGSLNRTVGGPSVPVYVSPFMDGDPRGKPKTGPLDSGGRRAVYINVRRNYLPDSLTVFDHPQPISTTGKRNVSIVSSQALFLMNNEFTHEMARRWVAQPGQNITRMYQQAFNRLPEPAEIASAEEFLKSADLASYAHVLLNTTEFLFTR
jgi:hypothetical protein